ncbi:MAG: OadG family protein [Clostridia bacterium]
MLENLSPFVVLLLGMGTVFVGLVLLILITRLLALTDGKKKYAASAAKDTAGSASETEIDGEMKAAVSAVLASIMGSGVNNIRILSIKRK